MFTCSHSQHGGQAPCDWLHHTEENLLTFSHSGTSPTCFQLKLKKTPQLRVWLVLKVWPRLLRIFLPTGNSRKSKTIITIRPIKHSEHTQKHRCCLSGLTHLLRSEGGCRTSVGPSLLQKVKKRSFSVQVTRRSDHPVVCYRLCLLTVCLTHIIRIHLSLVPYYLDKGHKSSFFFPLTSFFISTCSNKWTSNTFPVSPSALSLFVFLLSH